MNADMLGPLAICRLDRLLVDRIATRDRLGRLMVEAVIWIVFGASAYGAVLGGWRSGLQGVYAAAKLPILLLSLAAATAASNAVFAKLVGTRLAFDQVLCATMVCLATLAIVLGSVAPVSLLLSMSVERYGETLVGAGQSEIAEALRAAQRLLAFHVLVIGVSGIVAVRRLGTLLESLLGSERIARKLFWLCFSVMAFAGTQISWILRPYLGKPNLVVEFLRSDAFSGSFLEEVARWMSSA